MRGITPVRGSPPCAPPCGQPRSKLEDLSVEELRGEAQLQEQSYVRGQATDDAAALELFRRAIVERDQAAWATVIDIYRGLLVAQAGRQMIRGLVVEDDAFCVDRAFQRFWRATSSGRVTFSDLASILKYLKACLGTVLLDEARARRRQAWISLDDVPPEAHVSSDPSAQVISRVARRELWSAIERELIDPKERLVARLSFVGGLSPREIIARCPDSFEDVFEVYRTKRNMIERLRRSHTIQHLLD